MKDLKIVKVNNKLTTDSRDIALMVEKEHKILLRDIRNYINQMEGANKNMSTDLYPSDYFIENTYLDDYKRKKPCYAITKIGCDFIANKMTGIKGTAFTGIYTKKFDEMEKALKNEQTKLPTTYKEALQQLLIEVEEKEQLQLENQTMKPKADYFDALVERNLLTNIRDTSKELGVKEKVFVLWLIEKKYCYRDLKGKIKPYSNKMQYFELKEFTTPYGHSDTQTLINPKGREAFRLLLIKDGLIREKERECQITLLG
ncbi:TPA: Rha family transcriptional regulator [Clostridioides difficile]|nr:Rha family transcriptional regulator [Clostridioides difficile]